MELRYDEECSARFLEDPARPRRHDRSRAHAYVGYGNDLLEESKEQEDTARLGETLVSALEMYRKVLIDDPYSAEGTLRLAVTYDKLYRKGCALALLKRLARLEEHPLLAKGATRAITEIEDDPSLFAGYRNDALAAVGR